MLVFVNINEQGATTRKVVIDSKDLELYFKESLRQSFPQTNMEVRAKVFLETKGNLKARGKLESRLSSSMGKLKPRISLLGRIDTSNQGIVFPRFSKVAISVGHQPQLAWRL